MDYFEAEPKNSRSEIFRHQTTAINYVKQTGILDKEEVCCEKEKTMRIFKDEDYLHKLKYKCVKCGRTKPLFKGRYIESPKIELHEHLYVIYLWIQRHHNYNLVANSEISTSTIFRIKKNIYTVLKKENMEQIKKLGGIDSCVQVDETIIVKGKLVVSPSSKRDSIKNATWLVGVIEEKSGKYHVEIVPNRKKESMINFFKKFILDGTTVKTDGHKSYPSAVRSINGRHIIVNHEEGFRNSEGYSTNMIENLWSKFKYDIALRKGIKQSALGDYIEEFRWRGRNDRTASNNDRIAFFSLLKLLFNKKH